MPDDAFVNVKTFGAQGDGVTDDTDAINAAIAAAGTSGGLFFPKGTYLTGPLVMLDGQYWSGASRKGSVLKDRDGDKQDFILLANDSTLYNLGITGTFASWPDGPTRSTHFATRAEGKVNARLVDCWISKHFFWCVMFDNFCTSCGVVRCELDGTVHSHVIEINRSSHCYVDHCRIREGSNGVEIWPYTDEECFGNRITNNLIENNDGGVAVYGGHDTLIANNEIRDNQHIGVLLAHVQPLVPEIAVSTRTRIVGNTIVGNGVGTGAPGIYVDKADQSLISGNVVSDGGGHGIVVYEGTHVLTGNVVNRNWSIGIYVQSSPLAHHCILQGNQCNDNSMSQVGGGGGIIIGGSYHSITGNVCIDTRAEKRQYRGIVLSGESHVVVGNVTHPNFDATTLEDGSTGSILSANLT